MIAGHRQRTIQAFEYTLVLVKYRASLTMHHLAGAHHITAKSLADGLVAEADAKNRKFAGEMLDRFNRDAGFGRGARTGGHNDAFRVEGFDFSDGQFIVAHDFNLGAELAQVLHNVVGKGVVVIDHQQHGVKNLLNSLTLKMAFE
ncbi:hypothetical protein D3C75_557830 [compost metagenome]